MDETKRTIFPCVLLLLIASFALQLFASTDTIFYESFDDDFNGRWIASEKDEYQGVWKHSKSEGHDDFGLLVSEKARKYAIVKELDEPVQFKDGTVVLQFETRLQNGLECGGAYLKYLRPQEAGWVPKGFDNESPYTIMFGPDKCGATNKVHFILKHKNPKTGEFVEHHVKFPPSVPSDKLSHVYTAILKPNNEVQILIDGEEKKKVNFLSAEDFEPAYFELDKPDIEPIAAIGIEIWTTQDGILFDNILIASDANVVESYRKTVEAKNSLENYACNMKIEATKISEMNVFVFDPGGGMFDVSFLTIGRVSLWSRLLMVITLLNWLTLLECSTWSNGMVPLLPITHGKMLQTSQIITHVWLISTFRLEDKSLVEGKVLLWEL